MTSSFVQTGILKQKFFNILRSEEGQIDIKLGKLIKYYIRDILIENVLQILTKTITRPLLNFGNFC